MRTPGADFELAAGFLFGEGVVAGPDDVRAVRYCTDPDVDPEQQYNVVTVELAPGVEPDLRPLERHVFLSSSCGVCGKASLDALHLRGCGPLPPGPAVDPQVLVRDQFNNPVVGVAVTFAVTGGGGSVAGGTPVTNASGIATVTSWTLGGTSADAANGTMANSLSASATGAGSTSFAASAVYYLSGDVQPIYNARCAFSGCHIAGGTAPNLAAGSSHTSTVNVTSSCSPTLQRVNDFSASLSVLYLRVSTTTTCGGPMPPGASVTVPVAEQKIIRAWINNGAQNN